MPFLYWTRRVIAASLAALLAGCAAYSGAGLRPGVATVEDVRRTMGAPHGAYAEPGGEVWEYPHGPLGVETYMVHIDKDGVLRGIEQVLNEKGFARIEVGRHAREDVLRLIGSPWRSVYFDRRKETVWDYRFRDLWGYHAQFHVMFNEAGVVTQTMAIREVMRDHPMRH